MADQQKGVSPATPEPGVALPPIPGAKVLTGLSCASCGGAIEIQEGYTNVRCRYCETPLAVVGERGITRVMVLDELDQSAASQAVRRWFASGLNKEPALKHEARFDEAFLAWFPFVRARFDLVGWVLGSNRKRRKRGNRRVTEHEPVEVQVEEHVDRTGACANMAEFGVHHVNLAGDEILPLDEGKLRSRGMVFSPKISMEEAAEKLRATATAKVRETKRVDHVTFSWFAAVRRHITMVYYPMWVFRYRFRDRTYQVLIDAEDGSLAYGKAPGNHLYRALTLVASCAAVCFIGTTALQHLGAFLRSAEGLAGLGLGGLMLAGIVRWGYMSFRHGGVVEEGSGLAPASREKSAVETVKQLMEELE